MLVMVLHVMGDTNILTNYSFMIFVNKNGIMWCRLFYFFLTVVLFFFVVAVFLFDFLPAIISRISSPVNVSRFNSSTAKRSTIVRFLPKILIASRWLYLLLKPLVGYKPRAAQRSYVLLFHLSYNLVLFSLKKELQPCYACLQSTCVLSSLQAGFSQCSLWS